MFRTSSDKSLWRWGATRFSRSSVACSDCCELMMKDYYQLTYQPPVRQQWINLFKHFTCSMQTIRARHIYVKTLTATQYQENVASGKQAMGFARRCCHSQVTNCQHTNYKSDAGTQYSVADTTTCANFSCIFGRDGTIFRQHPFPISTFNNPAWATFKLTVTFCRGSLQDDLQLTESQDSRKVTRTKDSAHVYLKGWTIFRQEATIKEKLQLNMCKMQENGSWFK